MSEFSKRNKTKKVVFKKDFGKHYKEGTHYIHEDTVKQLKLEPNKDVVVSDIDWKAEYKKAAKNSAPTEPSK